ncbi:hypothetical protein ACN083_01965 [Rothia sp. CCM 9418]|uniref:hypothetical protein n=1 Tax=Rothia sp. CCM 9418 TaxID=3402661 RepID=UPI003ADE8A21
MMNTQSFSNTTKSTILATTIGGLAGGVIFGMMMAMMGMLPMLASMIGSESAFVGFAMHMMISGVFGALAGAIIHFSGQDQSLTNVSGALIAGSLIGVMFWIVGPLLMMPLMMGAPVFTITSATLLSLMGHIVYGVVMGLTAMVVLQRA